MAVLRMARKWTDFLFLCLFMLATIFVYVTYTSKGLSEGSEFTLQKLDAGEGQGDIGDEGRNRNADGEIQRGWGWNETAAYQLILENCNIPQVPLNHSGISNRLRQLPQLSLSQSSCDNETVFSEVVTSNSSPLGLSVIKLMKHGQNLSNCCVSQISRPFGLTSTHTIDKCIPIDPLTNEFPLGSMEYVMVVCDAPPPNLNSAASDSVEGPGASSKLNKKQSAENSPRKVYNFHFNVPLTGVSSLKLKTDFWRGRRSQSPEEVKTPPSVLLIVIDSTSRTEAYRSLPRTLKYLMEDLRFVPFKGHHALGEPTVTNLVGMLMGLVNKDFWTRYKLVPHNWWDGAPFIWNIFNKLNYVTGYFEDRADTGTFNYGGQRGFAHQPTDVFNFPFLVAYREKIKFDSQKICFGKKNSLEMMLDHQLLVLEKLGTTTPSFLVSWPCYPQHDFSHSSLLTQDAVYLSFLQRLRKLPSFKNTLVIITSDHAFPRVNRQLPYGNTHAGLLERRLMPLFVKLPAQLKSKSGSGHDKETEETTTTTMLQNLRWNSEGITSHLDLYRMLLHVAELAFESMGGDFNDLKRAVGGAKIYGTSLLQRIPHTRSCSEAGIPSTMCACNLPPILDEAGKEIQYSNEKDNATNIINGINLKLKESEFKLPFL